MVDITTADIIKDSLPNKTHKIIKEWIIEHQSELMRDWELTQNFQPLEKKTALTVSLENIDYFQNFFLDFGALCSENCFEFSSESLYIKLKMQNHSTQPRM